jgi:hypothetical protein
MMTGARKFALSNLGVVWSCSGITSLLTLMISNLSTLVLTRQASTPNH